MSRLVIPAVIAICVSCLCVSAIPESQFYGTYDMVHDGKWKGILTIEHNPRFDNDMVCSNLLVTYTAS